MKTDEDWEKRIDEIVKPIVEAHFKKHTQPKFDQLMKNLEEINKSLSGSQDA